MDTTAIHTSLTDVLHAFAQSLLAPDIILLLAFVGYALFSIGSVLVEYFTERRNFKVAMPKFLAALMAADEQDIPKVIADSGLLNRQKSALLTVFDYRTLPGDALMALIRREVNTEETRYDRITGRNNTAAKISPMLGLMGTLIPLGPGIEALGRSDAAALSSSLLIAFDTTVTGLIVAAICLAIGKIRNNWYNDYLSALDSGMATMLQKIDDMREAGQITTKEPTNYAFMFEEGLKKEAHDAKRAADAQKAAEAEGARAAHEAEVARRVDEAINAAPPVAGAAGATGAHGATGAAGTAGTTSTLGTSGTTTPGAAGTFGAATAAGTHGQATVRDAADAADAATAAFAARKTPTAQTTHDSVGSSTAMRNPEAAAQAAETPRPTTPGYKQPITPGTSAFAAGRDSQQAQQDTKPGTSAGVPKPANSATDAEEGEAHV